MFGLYLHFGEDSSFWLNLGIQALATLWILQMTLRVFGLLQPFRLIAIGIALILGTALPWLASMLLTDIFTGLSVLALFILALHAKKSRPSKNARCLPSSRFPPPLIVRRWRCCSDCVASAGWRGRCCASVSPRPA